MSIDMFPRASAMYCALVVHYDAAACPTESSPTVKNVRAVVA